MSALSILKTLTSHPLTKTRPLGAIFRFLQWQIQSRTTTKPLLRKWIGDTKFFARRGETGLTGNIYTGLLEFEDMSFVLHFLRPEDLFIDIGANSGAYTILACGVAKAHGIAFEPIPSVYRRLTKNIQLNQLEHIVKAENLGLGDSKGALHFTNNNDTVNHVVSGNEKTDQSEQIRVTTLDLYLEQKSPSLIKIDVEGYEKPVFDGARQTLKNQNLKAIIVELNGSGSRYGFDESQIVKILKLAGFRCYKYNPKSRSLQEANGTSESSGNSLFIRDPKFVEERVKSAPKFEILGQAI